MLQRFDERNRDLIVNINGRLVHRDEAGVSPFDSAVQGGDAVWEGLRLYSGRSSGSSSISTGWSNRPRRWRSRRFRRGSTSSRKFAARSRPTAMTDGVHMRLTLTRGVKITSGMDPRLNTAGPTLIVLAEHKPPVYSQDGLSLVTSSVRRSPPDCLDPKIHHNNLLSSILAKIEANVAGADDAVMLDVRGFVAETNATHVFIVERAGSVRRAPWRVPKASRARPCSSCARHTGSRARSAICRWPRSTARTRCSAPARWASWRRSRASMAGHRLRPGRFHDGYAARAFRELTAREGTLVAEPPERSLRALSIAH